MEQAVQKAISAIRVAPSSVKKVVISFASFPAAGLQDVLFLTGWPETQHVFTVGTSRSQRVMHYTHALNGSLTDVVVWKTELHFQTISATALRLLQQGA